MELILIDSDRLKIMLSREDMKKYNIDEEADYSKHSTRCAIRDILRQAKDTVGFSTEGESFFVQLFTSRRGGCEIFVTRGESEEDRSTAPPTSPERRYVSVYSFSSLSPLLAVCRRLADMGVECDSKVFLDIYGKYYLYLSHSDLSPYTRLSKFTFILEYGKRQTYEKFDEYIAEYQSFVCNDGINIFGRM